MNAQKKTLAVVMGGAFAASLAVAPVVHAEQNPFAAKSLGNGYMVAEADGEKMKDGKCATGKCSSNMKKKAKAKAAAEKAKEGNCSAEMKDKEGNCSAEMKAKAEADAKAKEGNCSAEKAKEGKCSANK